MAEKIEFETGISRHYNKYYFFVIIPKFYNKRLENVEGTAKVTIELVKKEEKP